MKENVKKILTKLNVPTGCVISFCLGCIVTVVGLYITGSAMVNNLKPDSKIEEFTESVIEEYTGITLDLTPDSLEEK